MIQAQLHGKAPSELTWSEDILTSNIFGMLKYLTTPEITVNILRSCINLDYDSLFIPNDIDKISYYFWPQLQKSEPDLVLVLHSAHGDHLVGIEAKYLSKKSSIEDYEVDQLERDINQRDQLAREIEDLYLPKNYTKLKIKQDRILSLNMIYLTLDSYLPREEISETIQSIGEHGKCPFKRNQLYWLTWKSIYGNLENGKLSSSDNLIIEDLKKYLVRKDLRSFSGYTMSKVHKLSWSYMKKNK